MAKTKENKYNILHKTANGRGVMYCTQNGINYIGNAYMVVYGMNDDEFNKAIEKAKAVENLVIGEQASIIIDDVKGHKVEGEYTKVCYDSANGMISFFRADNEEIVPIQYCFFEFVKELPVNKVWCYSDKAGVVIELTDGRSVVIMPYIITKEKIEKIIKEIYK